MADETKVDVEPQGPGQEPEGTTTESEYITKEQFEAFGKTLQEGIAKNFQAVQSQTDRYQARVQQGLEGFEKTLQRLQGQGVELTPQQQAAMRNDVLAEALQAPPETEPGEPGDQGDEPDPYNQAITDAGVGMMKAAGITIEDDDPEVKIIQKAAEGEVDEYFTAIQQAIDTKRERMAQEGQTPTGATMPGLAGQGAPSSNPIQNMMDSDQLWKEAKRQGKI